MQEITTKTTGSQLTAAEFNNIPDELENAITDTGITLSGADRHQLSKSISNYVGSGDYYSATGTNDYVLSVIGTKEVPTALVDGLRLRFRVPNTNTGASTVNPFALGVKGIKKYGGVTALEAGDLTQNAIAELSYVLSLDVFELISIENPIIQESIPLIRPITGCLPANNTTAPTTDLDIKPGTWRNTFNFNAYTLTTTITKRITVNWTQGTGNGGFPSGLTLTNNTWYHVFLIAKLDGTIDAGFDSSISATNLLADATGYVSYRRAGSIRYGVAAIEYFTAFELPLSGKRSFYWDSKQGSNIVGVAGSAQFISIYTPPGVIVEAHLHGHPELPTGAATGTADIFLYSPLNSTPTGTPVVDATRNTLSAGRLNNAIEYLSGNDFSVYTNTSSQIKYYMTLNLVTAETFTIATRGWSE